MRQILKNKPVRAECKIYKMLETHAKKAHISFHTPGHKYPRWDITELSFSDNLSSPRGVIAEAEKDIAERLGAYKSFILTDGSTSGVLSMLHAAKALGVKRVLGREDSHKSLYNACALLGLELLLLPTKEKNGFPLPPTADDLSCEQFFHADAVFLTSPDYYGNIPDLAKIRALCDGNKKLLFIDGAHGGHLHFEKKLHAGGYADLWVDGVHKSLPALTQGATVSAKTEKGGAALKKAVDIFRTTSPSYPIMASVEYAVKYPANEKLEKAVRAFAAENTRAVVKEDWTKLCCLFGDNAFEADKRLQNEGIYSEFCDGNVICFYLSPATSMRNFKRLTKRLKRLFNEYPLTEKRRSQRVPVPSVFEKTEIEWVEIEECENRISAGRAGLFPPCTPLIFEGEQITKEQIEKMKKADNVFGMADGKIAVYKKEERS